MCGDTFHRVLALQGLRLAGKKKDWEKFITTWFSNAPRYVRVKNDRR